MSWEVWGDPLDPPEMTECGICGGTGENDDPLFPRACTNCDGTGEVEVEPSYFDDDV